MRVASLFSGAGGFELGLGDSHKLVLLNDIYPEARHVLSERFPQVTQIEDVLSVLPQHIEDADAIVAGFPCQDVSIVGGHGRDAVRVGRTRVPPSERIATAVHPA